MIALIGTSFVAVCFWAITIKCLIGCDWILINGPNMLPKEDKIKFKAKHDMVGLNRYIGKTVLLSAAILFSLITIFVTLYTQFNFAWVSSGWFAWPFVFVCIVLGVRMFVAVPKIMGTKFEK